MSAHRTLAGLPFVAHSPSLFEYNGAWIGYDGRSWLVGALGQWGTREFPTRQAAAETVYRAFHGQEENLG